MTDSEEAILVERKHFRKQETYIFGTKCQVTLNTIAKIVINAPPQNHEINFKKLNLKFIMWELLDILGPHPIINKKNSYLLVIGDYFTTWTKAIPIKNRTSVTVAKKHYTT
jgi:hypothetical protein